jgi:DNA polymerase III subunit delta'
VNAGTAVERWGLVGHVDAVDHLATSVASGRVAHAYLITGPSGTGRTTLALTLARTLNCNAAASQRPCGTCDSCRRITRGVHPDVTVVDLDWQERVIPRNRGTEPRSRRELSIDAVRWLREDIVSRPVQGRWKFQIIDDASMLSDMAIPAFLKTLEEPPPYAVIVLVAETEDAVPETIRSRCQRLSLGAVDTGLIYGTLRERGIDDPVALQLARAARGRIAWALGISANPERRAERREKVERAFEQISTPLGRVSISGTMARDYSKKREETLEFLDYWAGLWRDALLYRTGLHDQTAFPEVGDRLKGYASQWQIIDLYRALSATSRCVTDLDSNLNARAALHAMVMQWPE